MLFFVLNLFVYYSLMRKILFLLFFNLFVFTVVSQVDSTAVDPRYLEDQLYFSTTYNAFSKTPEGFVQDGFAYGFSLGFIKDIPFNKRRNVGIALGLGYSYNTFIQNVVASDALIGDASTFNFDDTFTLKLSSIEMPFELRWRTSTLEKYKFWRIYTGITFSYILNSVAVSEATEVAVDVENAIDVEKFQYALTIAAGYGSWNLYMNYALSPFFDKDTVLSNGEKLEMSTFRMGLIFYFF